MITDGYMCASIEKCYSRDDVVVILRDRLAKVEAQMGALKDALKIIADDETDYPRVVARGALDKLEETK